MTVLFFIIFIITISAHSMTIGAHGDVDSGFYHIVGTQGRQPFCKIYPQKDAGGSRTVIVNSQWNCEGEREVIIRKPETQERLVFKLGFSRKGQEALKTYICYGDCYGDEKVVVSSCASVAQEPATNSFCGTGYVGISMPSGALRAWQRSTPVVTFNDGSDGVIKRPDYEGIISGNAERIDVTQYLFGSHDRGTGYFVRMSVQYANIGAVQILWGQERYFGVQKHGTRGAETRIFGRGEVVRFTDAPAPEFPGPVQYPIC